MSYNNGARTITNGLVMAFDAANVKCFKGEPTTNLALFGIADGFNSDTPANIATGVDNSITYKGKSSLRIIASNGYWNLYKYPSGYYTQTSSAVFTFSWKMKRADRVAPNISGYLYTAAVSTYPSVTVTPIEDGWYQCYCTYNSTNSTPLLTGFNSSQLGIFYITDWQLEAKTYYTPFVSGSRGTTVATGGGMYDLSQTGNHGELVNGPTYNTGSGGNILFDGTDDYINVPYNASTISFPTNNATICAWYRVSTSGDAYGNLVTQRSSGGSGFQTYVISNKLYADGGGTGGIYSTITGVAGTIYFGTIVFDKLSAQLKLYVNGEYNTQTSYTGTIQDTYPIRIGNGAFGDGPFPGHIYMASVYNRALSADEIRRIYNSTKSRFGL